MQPRNEKFFPFAGCPNAVERAAILPEVVAPGVQCRGTRTVVGGWRLDQGL
jgi:hypothetical protein